MSIVSERETLHSLHSVKCFKPLFFSFDDYDLQITTNQNSVSQIIRILYSIASLWYLCKCGLEISPVGKWTQRLHKASQQKET